MSGEPMELEDEEERRRSPSHGSTRGQPQSHARGPEDRGAYHLIPPNEQKLRETREIRAKDEAALAALNAQKRNEGLRYIRETGQAVLGGGQTSEVDGRRMHLDMLEEQGHPGKRKTAARKKEQEDAKASREERERKRLIEWQAREADVKEKAKVLGEKKKASWVDRSETLPRQEVQEVFSAAAAAPSAASSRLPMEAARRRSETPISLEEILGRWAPNGNKARQFMVKRTADKVQFEDQGTGTYGDIEQRPVTLDDGQAFVVHLQKAGAPLGKLALRPCGGCLITRFQKPFKPWSEGKINNRLGDLQVPQEDEVRPPMETGYMDQLIPPDPGLWQCGLCTLINQAGGVNCDGCGNPRIVAEHVSEEVLAALAACDMQESGLRGSASRIPEQKPIGAPPCEALEKETLEAWLQSVGLEQFTEALEDAGFRELKDLLEPDEKELEEVFNAIKVDGKPGLMFRFRRELRDRRSRK
mmetsp:Transcript_58862/g.131657  ORF Transcript_58862/g.131657 Transcript_58862/m.131657 type:complete len:473 (-) Transcript_58862:40-1458(-)